MHFFKNSDQKRRSDDPTSPVSTSQSGSSSSTYVSTLSNALNITTPSPKKRQSSNESTGTTPTRSTVAHAVLQQSTPKQSSVLRTPVRLKDPPTLLSLSDHEAFLSPSTPVSPWPVGPRFEQPRRQSEAASAQPSHDQQWLSEPSLIPQSSDIEHQHDPRSSSQEPKLSSSIHLLPSHDEAILAASSSNHASCLPHDDFIREGLRLSMQDQEQFATEPHQCSQLFVMRQADEPVLDPISSHQRHLCSPHAAPGIDAWDCQGFSDPLLGLRTESSFRSQSSASFGDVSLSDMSSFYSGPASASADSSFIMTPILNSSFIRNQSLQQARSYAPAPCAQSSIGTPEVAMQDLSEFVQSVPIEQMAESRWRTWPRAQDRFPSASQQAPIPQALPPPGRTSFDSLTAVGSARPRAMVEPYSKTTRLSRSSSRASTSSQGSTSAIPLESLPSSAVPGPVRRRSIMASGLLRMTSTPRPSISNVNSSLMGDSSPPQIPPSLSYIHDPITSPACFLGTGSSPMQATKSSDALPFPAARRHSAALQRSATSSEGITQIAQRRKSLFGLSPRSRSSVVLDSSKSASKARVGFNEVTAALDTLRLFLKQKDKDEPDSKSQSSSSVSSALPEGESTGLGSPSKQSRTLRRTKGNIPPRGTLSPTDVFGPLQSTATSTLDGAFGPSWILSPSEFSSEPAEQPRRAASEQEAEKLAVLEDLSERVRKLKAETERQTAVSMPPPTTRPVSTQLLRSNSEITRRQMHEEYLRKRASRS